MNLSELPGTAKECQTLEKVARNNGWKIETFMGAEASETRLRAVQSPGVLHLATHGFFLPDIEIVPEFRPIDLQDAFSATLKISNPMHRSGLALGGAMGTLQAWDKGEIPLSSSDGILTAAEVGLLNLRSTWLATLSACDTGWGEVRAGEGILGLRRGFVQAGTRNLLLTLWPISDEETVSFMKDFYARAWKERNAPSALAKVQRDWFHRLRQRNGLSAAVRLAGPFILTFMGRP
jgi:CHAT domain-containing protein